MNGIREVFNEQVGNISVDLGTVHHFSSGVYAKEMHLPKGYFAVSHAHAYDHLSILGAGRVVVETDESEPIELVAPACIEIKAGVHHRITAIEDATWFCIHATQETDPARVDHVAIGGA